MVLDLLSYMTGEGHYAPLTASPTTSTTAATAAATGGRCHNQPGYYTSICFTPAQLYNQKVTLERHSLLTYGSLSYYNHIAYDTYIDTIARHRVMIGGRTSGHTTRQMIVSYVQAAAGVGGATIYMILYYAIRCGCYQVAIDEAIDYNKSVPSKQQQVEESLIHLLIYIQQQLADYPSQGHNISSALPAHSYTTTPRRTTTTPAYGENPPAHSNTNAPSLSALLKNLSHHYQLQYQSYLTTPSPTIPSADIYELFVYNLLGIIDKAYYSTGYDMPGYTLEDFIWSHVFTMMLKLVYHRDGAAGDAGGGTASPIAQKKREQQQYKGAAAGGAGDGGDKEEAVMHFVG
jgi:hypothetical protein